MNKFPAVLRWVEKDTMNSTTIIISDGDEHHSTPWRGSEGEVPLPHQYTISIQRAGPAHGDSDKRYHRLGHHFHWSMQSRLHSGGYHALIKMWRLINQISIAA